MIQPLILWGHALAALLFAVLAVSQVRGAGSALPRLTFLIALGMTALWALAVAGIDAHELAPRVTESLRNLTRSETRRVGKECVITFRSRWCPLTYKKKIYKTLYRT